jgi:hypothetical protein
MRGDFDDQVPWRNGAPSGRIDRDHDGQQTGKRVLERLPARVFPVLIEVVLVTSGLQRLLF